ncbi:MAG: sensor histidine kinase N-terminal domain-containing protein, partial [Steroidobacteraceae bacterium]
MAAPVTRTFSLQRRLFVGLVGPLVILFLIAGVAGAGLAKYFSDSVYDTWLFDSVSSLALEVEQRPDGPFVDMPPQEQRLFVWDAADKTFFRITASKKGILVGRRDLPPVTGDVDSYQGAQLYDGMLDGEPIRIASLVLPASTYGETVRVEVAET